MTPEQAEVVSHIMVFILGVMAGAVLLYIGTK